MATGAWAGQKNLEWQNSVSKVDEANLKMLNSQKFCDVTFIVGEGKEKVDAHKLILMSRSPVFETMFERWETEQKSEIKLAEISSGAFKMFLEYVYSDKFSVKTGQDAAEVLYIAHKYNTKHLEKMCSEFLKTGINAGNAISIHDIAATLNQKHLETEAMNFILTNGKAVFKEDEFIHIKSGLLSTILQNDNLRIDELSVFHAIMRWAENQCNIQNLKCDAVNKRKVLKDLIHLVSFPLISSQDLTDEVVGKYTGILTKDEVIGLYMHHTTGQSVKNNKNLPVLPFSNQERCVSTVSYTISPYSESVSGNSNYQSCRYSNVANGYGNKFISPRSVYVCEEMFRFSTDQEICITAVELHPFSDKSHVSRDQMSISEVLMNTSLNTEKVEVIISSENSDNGKKPSCSVTKIVLDKTCSTTIHFGDGVKISKNKIYIFNTIFSMGVGSSFYRSSGHRAPGSLHSTAKVSCDNNECVNFIFYPFVGKCYRDSIGVGFNSYCPCISKAAVKTIHFTV